MTDVNEPHPEWKHSIPTNIVKAWDTLHTALKEFYGGESSGSARKSEPKNLLEELQKKDIVERS
ncbi:hypothetical protein FOXYSP1_18088 [Fusarium oxysporum f. sp. phaseoli]